MMEQRREEEIKALRAAGKRQKWIEIPHLGIFFPFKKTLNWLVGAFPSHQPEGQIVQNVTAAVSQMISFTASTFFFLLNKSFNIDVTDAAAVNS